MATIEQQIKCANERGIGQFHVFDGNVYCSTWRTLKVAEVIAKEKDNGAVYNDSGVKVA